MSPYPSLAPKARNSGISKTLAAVGTPPTARGRSFWVWFFLRTTVLGAIGITCLAIWVDWTKWTISRLLPQLPTLPSEEAIDLLHQLAPHTPASIPLLVQGLCDPRPEVAQIAQKELQELQQQWENQAWHQVSGSLSCLAKSLADQKERLPPHSRLLAQKLAEWILAWRPPEGSPERVQMIAACENLLVYLGQSGGPAPESGATESGRSPQQPTFSEETSSGGSPSGREIIDPMAGFRLPGGGLPGAGFSAEGLPSLPGSSSDTLHAQRSAWPTSSFSFPKSSPSSMPESPLPESSSLDSSTPKLSTARSSMPESPTSEFVVRIREPMEVRGVPPVAGKLSGPGMPGAVGRPRLNQAVRLSQTGSAENSQEGFSELDASGPPSPPSTTPDGTEPNRRHLTAKAKQTGSLEGPTKVSVASAGSLQQKSARCPHSVEAGDLPRPGDSTQKPGQTSEVSFGGPDPQAEKPDHLQQKEVGELLGLLAWGTGEEQKEVQAELAGRGFGHVSIQLARQLVDPNPQVRLDLVRRLPSMAGVEPVVWLVWLCRDPDPQVRSAAITLLATTKDPAILEEVEKLLAGQPDEPLRTQTHRLRSLGQEPIR